MCAICRRSWPNMSAISTTGARIDRWDNGRLVHRYHARLIETLKLERSSRYLCSEVFITFISNQYDDGVDLILAPYRCRDWGNVDHDVAARSVGAGPGRCFGARMPVGKWGVARPTCVSLE